MANNPQQPSEDLVELTLGEDTEFYCCPVAEALDANDLVPQTSGDLDVAPTTQVTRTLLHNGQDFVSPGARQANPFTVRAFLPDSNAKLQEIKAAMVAKGQMKFNVFYRDGSGHKGIAIPTRIRTTTEGEFAKDITFEPFLVEEIDAPAA